MPGLTAFSLETPDGTVLVASQREGTGQMVTGDVRSALAAVEETGELVLKVRQQPRVTFLASVAEVPGLGWRGWSPGDAAGAARSRSRTGRTAPDAVSSPTSTSPWPSTRRTARSRWTARRVRAPGRRRRRGRHVQLVPAGQPTRWSTRPTASTWRCWNGARCGPACWSSPATGGPPAGRASTGASARWRTRSSPRSSCGPASGRCGSRWPSTTAAATTGCGSTSRCPPPRPPRERSAPSASSSAGSPPRAARPRPRSPPTRPSGSCRRAG